jgi:hypothetical protein
VRIVDADAERDFIAKTVVAGAQAVARLAGIDRVGAEGEGGFQHGLRTGRREKFGTISSRFVENVADVQRDMVSFAVAAVFVIQLQVRSMVRKAS